MIAAQQFLPLDSVKRVKLHRPDQPSKDSEGAAQ